MVNSVSIIITPHRIIQRVPACCRVYPHSTPTPLTRIAQYDWNLGTRACCHDSGCCRLWRRECLLLSPNFLASRSAHFSCTSTEPNPFPWNGSETSVAHANTKRSSELYPHCCTTLVALQNRWQLRYKGPEHSIKVCTKAYPVFRWQSRSNSCWLFLQIWRASFSYSVRSPSEWISNCCYNFVSSCVHGRCCELSSSCSHLPFQRRT